MNVIHRVVSVPDVPSHPEVTGNDNLEGPLTEIDGQATHFREVAHDRTGYDVLRMTETSDLGDMEGEDTHSLEIRHDLDRADDSA